MAGGEVEEVDCRGMEADVESVLDTSEYLSFVDIVIASVDNASRLGPAFLVRSDGRPEDSLSAAACIATIFSSVFEDLHERRWHYQKGWKKPIMPSQLLSALFPFTELTKAAVSTSSQSSSSLFLALCSASNFLVSSATLAKRSSLRVREDRRRRCPTSSLRVRRIFGRKTAETTTGTSRENSITRRDMPD